MMHPKGKFSSLSCQLRMGYEVLSDFEHFNPKGSNQNDWVEQE